MSRNKINRALISVSDKTDLEYLGRELSSFGVEIISTGGTAKRLRRKKIRVVEVSEYAKYPEIMDGRVKTLQPEIYGGILSIRENPVHAAQMKKHRMKFIDLVVVNLYPFETIAATEKDFNTCIENIDIGGPTLVRAAAKNHKFVTVIVDPLDYHRFIEEFKKNDGATTEPFRKDLAKKAFSLTAHYDAIITKWLSANEEKIFPSNEIFIGRNKKPLRYGENPHQGAVFYKSQENRPGVSTAIQLHGKELSYNNINDTDAAFELVSEFQKQPACVIVKHANPCGVACAKTLLSAYNQAFKCDQESAFGGIIAFNSRLDEKIARKLIKVFSEVVIAPKITKEARKILSERNDLRVLETGTLPNPKAFGKTLKSVSGGYLCQTRDNKLALNTSQVVTKLKPSKKQLRDLWFAFTVAKHVKSNAIVYAKNETTVGIGAGQMSRVNSSRIAAWKAAENAEISNSKDSWAVGSVVASDAFFPFVDGLLAAAEAGAKAVIQPGGSVRDHEIIRAADENGLSMIFTNMRHFRH